MKWKYSSDIRTTRINRKSVTNSNRITWLTLCLTTFTLIVLRTNVRPCMGLKTLIFDTTLVCSVLCCIYKHGRCIPYGLSKNMLMVHDICVVLIKLCTLYNILYM